MYLKACDIKTFKKIIIVLIFLLGLIPVSGYLALQVPAVQELLAGKGVEMVQKHIQGHVSIDKIMVVFFNKAILKDVAVTGEQGDTLVSFKKLSVSISSRSLLRGKIKATRVIVSDGVFNYQLENSKKESNITRIFNIDPYAPKDTSSSIPHLYISEFRMKNFRFHYSDPFGNPINADYPDCMDYTNISVSEINARFNKLVLKEGTLDGRIQEFSCKEKSGLTVLSLTGDYHMEPGLVKVSNLRMKDGYSSEVSVNYLSFSGYTSGKDWAKFTDKVSLGADFTGTVLDFRTLSKFTPELKNNHLIVKLFGEVTGPVADLQSESLRIESLSEKTLIHLSLRIQGLPKIHITHFTGNIFDCHTQIDDASMLLASFSGKKVNPRILSITPGTTYRYRGTVNGVLDNLHTDGAITSAVGEMSYDVSLLHLLDKTGISIDGKVSTTELDLGKFLGSDMVGPATLDVDMYANLFKKDYGGVSFTLDSLTIGKLEANHYPYSGIKAKGTYSEKNFNGRIISTDPNLKFLFHGVCSLRGKTNNRIYKFFASVPYVNLAALNIDKQFSKSELSFSAIADVSYSDSVDFLGTLSLDKLSYVNDNGNFAANSIKVESTRVNDFFKLKLLSPFLSAEYMSTQTPTIFISELSDIVLFDQFDDVFRKSASHQNAKTPGKYSLTAYTHNTNSICDVLFPGLYIADSTKIDATLNEKNELDIKLNSGRLAIGRDNIKNLSVTITNPDTLLLCKANCDNIHFSGTDLNNNQINIQAADGIVDLSYIFSNNGNTKDELELSSDIFFSRDSLDQIQTNIYINESELSFKKSRWNIRPCIIALGNKNYSIKDFKLSNAEQSLTANGKISLNPDDTIGIALNKFDLSILNSLAANNPDIVGTLTGTATMKDLYGSTGILMDIESSNVSIAGDNVGIFSILSKWDTNEKRLNILVNNYLNSEKPINVSGYYKPDSGYFDMNIALQKFSLKYVDAFIPELIANTSGSISGEDIRLYGTFSKIYLTGDYCTLNNFGFTPVYTNVHYIVDGPFMMTESGIRFNSITLTDPESKYAVLSGGISYDSFKDIRFDNTKLSFNQFQCLNTESKDNDAFYGKVFASGSATLTGAPEDLSINAEVTTNDRTDIHIPVTSSASASSNNLLTFTKVQKVSEDEFEARIASLDTIKKSVSKFRLSGKANITPDAALAIEINKELGNVISCRGEGTIGIELDPSKDIFDLNGDYTITNGNYNFALGFVSRNFNIKEDGKLAFNGDLKNSTINLEAGYTTKASISALISDSSAVSRKDVNCLIKMSGAINNPTLNFDIDIPDLDPLTKGRVQSALSTEDKVQRQLMAILVTGSFIPEQSGISNNSTIIFSNASEIFSNQLNNVFRQLEIPLDLGLNYQPGNSGKNDMFDVDLSYQAFNNRVVINGNVGNSQKSSSNWTGNFEAEVKIDKRGKMRANAFTRSADDYSNYLDNTQRSGIGFTYQDEFDSFRELIRNLFMKKSKREEYETRQQEKAIKELTESTKEVK